MSFPRACLIPAVILLAACRAADPPEKEPWVPVLEAIADRLEIQPPIPVHPLVGQLERRPDLDEFDLTSFYREDSLPVFRQAPDRFVACTLASSGACVTPVGQATVVLSEYVDIGNDAVMLIAFVADARNGGLVQSYFRVRARYGGGVWTVYRFERV